MPRTTRNSRRNASSKKKGAVLNKREQAISKALVDLLGDASSLSLLFEGCQTRDDEFQKVKKTYHRAALKHHPDKGGDPAQFRRVHASFELLKELHTKKNRGGGGWLFSDVIGKGRTPNENESDDNDDDNEEEEPFDYAAYYAKAEAAFSNAPPPSWEFYQQAEQESVPPYRVELAKSARSKCQASGKTKNCANDGTKANKKCTALVDTSDKGAPDKIEKGEIRIGVLNEQSGTYSRWVHLRCWRIPIKVWLGLPQQPNEGATAEQFAAALSNLEEVLLTGFSELPHTDQQAFIAYCQDKKHWAVARSKQQKAMVEQVTGEKQTAASKKTTSKKKKRGGKKSKVKKEEADEEEETPEHDNAQQAQASSGEMEEEDDVKPAAKPNPVEPLKEEDAKPIAQPASMAIVPAAASTSLVEHRQKFVIPIPGRNGASDATVFSNKRFVLTGLFPEVGGGAGLDIGKGRVKAMIASFGGRVTGSISGKTDCLVVGKEPGMSKVSKARNSKICKLASLHDLKVGLDNGLAALEDFDFYKSEEPMKIRSFSMGYQYANPAIGYNGLAARASKKELAIAQGLMEPDNDNDEMLALPASTSSNSTRDEPAAAEEQDAKPAAKKKTGTKKKKAAPKKRQALADVAFNEEDRNSGDVDGKESAKKAPAAKKRKTTRATKAAAKSR